MTVLHATAVRHKPCPGSGVRDLISVQVYAGTHAKGYPLPLPTSKNVKPMNDHTAQQSFIHTTGPLGRHGAAVGNALRETREAWPGLSTYERFEQVVSLVLTALIGLVIIAAVVNLTVRVVTLVLFGVLDPAEHGVFQAIFGMIFTVLIALEFNHSILGVLERKESIVQVKTVVLIALLALARKFIILDATKTEPMIIIGLAVAVLALGAVYWFVRDQDRRAASAEAQAPDGSGA